VMLFILMRSLCNSGSELHSNDGAYVTCNDAGDFAEGFSLVQGLKLYRIIVNLKNISNIPSSGGL